MTPQVGKWYLTRAGHTAKILSYGEWGYHASNDEVYNDNGKLNDFREHHDDLDMDRGPIEPSVEELALYALFELWASYDNAGESAFTWTKEEASAVKEALVKAGRIRE